MAANDLTLAMRLLLDSQQFVRGLAGSRGAVSKFAGGVKAEIGNLRNVYNSAQGKLAAIGVTVGTTAAIIKSARLDKNLIQIGLTAGASATETEKLRQKLWQMAKETGTSISELQDGFNDLVQAGLSFKEALPVIDATNKATAVTNANVSVLTKGLTVASAAFNFDLSKPQLALTLLDKMTVAGRLGNAELENLSDTFARIGVNAKAAGMGFDETLAFVEGLSLFERQPERLGTLADSTLRIFTNNQYRLRAQAATGVKFFDAAGTRRDALSIFNDLRAKYDTLTTDEQRQRFMNAAFGRADMDTIKGLRTMLTDGSVKKISDFFDRIGVGAGTLVHDLPRALDQSVNQVGRLKATLGEVADAFAKPINKVIDRSIQQLLNKKSQGGWQLSGNELVGYGAGLAASVYVAGRLGGPLLKKIFGKAAGVEQGVIAGKALEQVGVVPVYVTNYSQFGGGISSTVTDVAKAGLTSRLLSWLSGGTAIAVGTRFTGGVGLAGAAGYGIGTWLHSKMDVEASDRLGDGVARMLAFFGSKNAQEAVALRDKFNKDFQGNITVSIEDNRTRVTQLSSNGDGLNIETSIAPRGKMMAIP